MPAGGRSGIPLPCLTNHTTRAARSTRRTRYPAAIHPWPLCALVPTRRGRALREALDAAAAASFTGDWRQSVDAAGRLAERAGHTATAVVRDALAAGADWWLLGELLGLHPQATYERYQALDAGLRLDASPGAIVGVPGLDWYNHWRDCRVGCDQP